MQLHRALSRYPGLRPLSVYNQGYIWRNDSRLCACWCGQDTGRSPTSAPQLPPSKPPLSVGVPWLPLLIHPGPAACPATEAAQGGRHLSSASMQAFFTSAATPLEECRLMPVQKHSVAKKLDWCAKRLQGATSEILLGVCPLGELAWGRPGRRQKVSRDGSARMG